MTIVMEARNIHKSYKLGEIEVQALRGVDLSVQMGEFFAIMGPSGSGKSTLLHLLGGLDSPSSGEVVLDGKSLNGLKDAQLARTRRKDIGFIFQFFNLLPTLTAAENVYLPFLLDNNKGKQKEDKVQQMLAQVGLSDRAHHLPNQLSGGEQQRVAIARALVIDPRIILADEPTGNLDSTAAENVLNLLRTASNQYGQTILMVSHDRKAAEYADRILILQDGKLVGTT